MENASAIKMKVGLSAGNIYRLSQLQSLLAGAGAEIEQRDATATQAIWSGIRDVAAFHDGQGDVWRVSCKPSDAPGIAARSGAERWTYDWAGGLIWLRSAAGHDLRAAIGPMDGHATLVRADAQTKARLGVFHPEPAGVARLTAALRAQFDPKGIFNAGQLDRAA